MGTGTGIGMLRRGGYLQDVISGANEWWRRRGGQTGRSELISMGTEPTHELPNARNLQARRS